MQVDPQLGAEVARHPLVAVCGIAEPVVHVEGVYAMGSERHGQRRCMVSRASMRTLGLLPKL